MFHDLQNSAMQSNTIEYNRIEYNKTKYNIMQQKFVGLMVLVQNLNYVK